MFAGPCALREDGQPDDYLYVGFNFSWDERSIAMPVLKNGQVWKKVLDTSEKSGGFIQETGADKPESYEKELIMAPRSVVVLIGCDKAPQIPEEEEKVASEEIL